MLGGDKDKYRDQQQKKKTTYHRRDVNARNIL
jgi:hypothetical protein